MEEGPGRGRFAAAAYTEGVAFARGDRADGMLLHDREDITEVAELHVATLDWLANEQMQAEYVEAFVAGYLTEAEAAEDDEDR